MEPVTLVTSAIALVTPYLVKSGEKFAESVGESVWNWIKNSFSKKSNEESLPKGLESGWEEKLTTALLEAIKTDKNFKVDFEIIVKKSKGNLEAHYQQNINNNGDVEKQINIQHNTGNIQM